MKHKNKNKRGGGGWEETGERGREGERLMLPQSKPKRKLCLHAKTPIDQSLAKEMGAFLTRFQPDHHVVHTVLTGGEIQSVSDSAPK